MIDRAVLATLIVVFLHAMPAQAQSSRTWVSGVGDDANPCSRTAPCKTFAGAISKTATSGEINCLDPGGFGAVTITKSLSIVCAHTEGGVLAAGTNGVIVNVGTNDKVLLEGLDIEGFGTGLNGVRMVGAGKLTIRKCSIRNFTAGTGFGVDIQGSAGARVFLEDNLIIGNLGGINVKGAAGAANNAFLTHSLVDANTNFVLQVDGASVVAVTASTLTGSPAAIITTNGGSFISFGGNLLRGTGAPTQTLPLL
ncbi:MAG: right-handed parallel beta-helix repeat-containing protein [Armatimonadetes bacterium]|nr:right-handed parallel beta-helix repeat-containing protein [Armatimonadota bacterium]